VKNIDDVRDFSSIKVGSVAGDKVGIVDGWNVRDFIKGIIEGRYEGIIYGFVGHGPKMQSRKEQM
jgi:hypothetical protein